MAKLLGVDYGTKKTGLALSDEEGKLAFPHEVLPTDNVLPAAIYRIVLRHDVRHIVLGEPTGYGGRENLLSEKVRAFKKKLEEQTGVPVSFISEILTTQEAKRLQGEDGNIDASAAALILQQYLDVERERAHAGGEHTIFAEALSYKDQFWRWFMRHGRGPHARAWLAFFAFTESIFFPIPVDPLLIAMVVANMKRWLYLSLYTIAFSVVGGAAGYAIGLLFFESLGRPIVEWYGLADEFNRAGRLFADNAFWTMFIAAFTPIPYKIFTLSAGFFKINFAAFFLASIIGRGLRFLGVALVARLFGALMARFAYKYFNYITIIIVVVAFVFFLVF